MRSRLVQVASLIAAAVLAAACAGAAPPPDAYDLLTTSMKATWSPIQVNVGAVVTDGVKTITLDRKDIVLVVDTAAGAGAFHMSLPAAGLGIPPGALAGLGIDGDSVDVDMLWAGDAMYARSAALRPMLKMFLGPVGKLPAGDLTGWLKIGTKEELAAIGALTRGASGMPSFAPPSGAPQTMKESFESVGVSLTLVGTEKHGGADRQHIAIGVDLAKLAASPYFALGAGARVEQSAAMLKGLAVSGDLWLDPATGRIVEANGHIASATDPARSGDVTITAGDPDGSVSLEAPSAFVDIPLGPLVTQIMKMTTGTLES